MKIREMLEKDIDVDVANDVTDNWYPAFVGPTYVTEAGAERFAGVLDLEVELNDNCAVVLIDQYEDWETKNRALAEFFGAVAGYCPADDWDKWFTYEVV